MHLPVPGLALGVGAAFPLTRTYLFNFAPVALALPTVIGVAVGEALTPRPARLRGAASLRTRRLREYVPARTTILIGLLVLGMLVFSAYPSPYLPDHSIIYSQVAPPTSLASALATLGALALIGALAAWAVVRSPQVGVDATGHAIDDAWRRATVDTIANTCAALFAAVFAATAFWYADQQMDWRGGGQPVWGVILSGLAGVGVALFVVHAGALATTSAASVDAGAALPVTAAVGPVPPVTAAVGPVQQ